MKVGPPISLFAPLLALGSVLWSCSPSGPDAPADADADGAPAPGDAQDGPAPRDLSAAPQDLSVWHGILDRAGSECRAILGGACGIAVRDLATGDEAQSDGGRRVVSASSAKFIWVAAALKKTSIDKVQPLANPIFAHSDNAAAGKAINLAGPAYINPFMHEVAGMSGASVFCNWMAGQSQCPGDNYLTAGDSVIFLSKLWQRQLLPGPETDAILQWSTWSPRSGYGGWLGTQLPAAARAAMHHKPGWLPPAVVPGYAVANEIGIVEFGPGRAYAVAILTDGPHRQANYDQKQLPAIEYTSCVIYHALAGDAADPFAPCRRP